MKLLFTLDYELFLGTRSGTVDECLIKPLDRYSSVAEEYGLRFTLFVDASYLYRLMQYADKYTSLRDDLDKLTRHLRELNKRGHDIQLHIHPQWYYSSYDGNQWHIDTKHYKLSDVDKGKMKRLFHDSKALLDGMIGGKTVAFRAGGFSAQPTDMLAELFSENDILLDSSVCPGAFYDSLYQEYDYRDVPMKDLYRFEEDICAEHVDGRYQELPITMHRVSPLFHWKLVAVRLWSRLSKSRRHANYGDGLSVRTTGESILHRLMHYCDTMATIDGYKISFLKEAINANAKAGHDLMCVLGHPKLATPYSVEKLKEICAYAKEQGHEFCTISDLTDKV